MFDADDPNSQLFLTRVLQALASANTRKIVELLGQGPRSLAELLQVMDSTESRIKAAMLVLQAVGLVSEGRDREGTATVYLLNRSGLNLARSWLDRIDTIAGRPSQS
jgi:DNA-binding transcriptional ArsR family regulator